MWYQVSNVNVSNVAVECKMCDKKMNCGVYKVSNVSNVAVECKMCGRWQKVSRAENLRQWLGRCPSPARNEITLLKNTLFKNTPLKNTLLKKYTFQKYTFESAISLPIVSVCCQIDVWDLPQLKLLQDTSFSSKTTKLLHFYPKLQKSCDNSLWYLLLIVLLLGCALGFCM